MESETEKLAGAIHAGLGILGYFFLFLIAFTVGPFVLGALS